METSLRKPDQRADGAYTLNGIANLLNVTTNNVRYWVQRGWLRSIEGGGRGRIAWFNMSKSMEHRLRRIKAEHSRQKH